MKGKWFIIFFILIVLLVIGCSHYHWRIDYPPGSSQADYQRDMAYCNDYARTWCATNGTVVVSGSRQDYQWGQRTVNISGNRSCGGQEFDNVRMDCMRMKGYTCTLEKVGQERSVQPIQEKKTMGSEAMAYNNRGVDYSNKGQNDQAITDFTKAIEIDPNYAMAYNDRGRGYSNKGQNDQAITDFTKAIEIDPKYVMAYYNRGTVYVKRGQNDQAIADFTKAIEIDPKYVMAYNNRGIAYGNKGQHDQAIADLTKAIEIDPQLARPYFNRGLSYYIMKEYGKSWEDVKKAQNLGYQIPFKFLEDLRRASGRQN